MTLSGPKAYGCAFARLPVFAEFGIGEDLRPHFRELPWEGFHLPAWRWFLSRPLYISEGLEGSGIWKRSDRISNPHL